MKNLIISSLLLTFSQFAFSCVGISGTYETVSESHWSYTIRINEKYATVEFSNYWYGGEGRNYGEERYGIENIYTGYCEKTESGYILKYNNIKLPILFDSKLSAEDIGEDGHYPGITAEFTKNKPIKLWDLGSRYK